jgi:glycosyltransferase involved in cell wall biosynthesis
MSAKPMRLAVCVVTYQERFVQSAVCKSLAGLPPDLLAHLSVVSVCNAAPGTIADAAVVGEHQAGGLRYREVLRSDNRGLAGGYNAGLEIALEEAPDAALFLNADAWVEAWYLSWLLDGLRRQPDREAFAPTLMSGTRCVSPFRKRGMALDFYIIGWLCLRDGPFLRQLRFPDEFWLDGIDYWLSVKMADAGLRVERTERRIAHNLSVSDQFGTLPGWRYRNILVSERRFLRWQKRPFREIAVVHARALARCLRYGRFDLAQVVAKEFAVALHE